MSVSGIIPLELSLLELSCLEFSLLNSLDRDASAFRFCHHRRNRIYWLFYGHYVYTWDILLWIGGLIVIDVNLAEWRHELEDEHDLKEQAEVENQAQ